MRKISIIFIFLTGLCGCFRSPGAAGEGAEHQKELENLLLNNVLNTEAFDIPSGINLVDERGEKMSVDSIFAEPKLVVRFDYSCCDNCLQAEVDNIHKVFKGQEARLVVGIGTYETPRSLRIMKEKFGMEFPLFFLTMAESRYIFPSALENLHYPYLFTTNKELVTEHAFLPSSALPHVSIRYYDGIKERLTGDKTVVLFARPQLDAGKIKLDKEYSFQFSYTNPTGQPVIINDIKTTCGCTVPSWDKTPLLPGKTEVLTIKFTPNTLGFHAKKIFVYTSLSPDPISLLIKAVVME